jgi:hypothetical protein
VRAPILCVLHDPPARMDLCSDVQLQGLSAQPAACRPRSGFQYYDAEKLHNRPHYMTTKPISSLIRLYGDRPINVIKSLKLKRQSKAWNALKNLVEKEGKVNKRGNIVLTKGFSGQAMRKTRKEGGVPPLTIGGMSEKVAKNITPTLTYLTKKVLEKGYKLRGGDMFSQKILKGNFYEAVAVAVTMRCTLSIGSFFAFPFPGATTK